MDKNDHLVILVGGQKGEADKTPQLSNQFVGIQGDEYTALQQTFARFEAVVPKENTWVVTSKELAPLVMEQLPVLPQSHLLIEPCSRNTAPCIAYVSWRIKAQNPKAKIVVTPSDCMVEDVEEFHRVISSCLKFVDDSDAIVTLGIKPTRPETRYGYIQAELSYASARNKELYRVDSFKEKPDAKTAEDYLKQNNFFWNSGIFIWNVSTVVNAFRVYQPAISEIFEGLLPVYGTPEEQHAIDELYAKCESISVDYAILENAEDIFVFPTDFGWRDLG